MCPSTWTTTPTPPLSPKPAGALDAATRASFTRPSAPELAPESFSTARIFHGRTGAAGEGGHVSIDYRGPLCKCGKPGCIEVYASGTAIGKRARQKIADGGKSSMPYLAGGNLDAVTGEIVGKAYAAGDPLATEILTETAEMVALWLGNMIDLLDPHVIVIGGGAAALIQPFFDRIRRRIPQLTVNPRSSEVPIVSSRYGADSGIAGGAALCA